MSTGNFLEISITFVLKLYSLNVINKSENRIGTSESIPSLNALPVRNLFPAQTCTFPNGWLNPPLSIHFFFFITQSFMLPSIIETRQAAPRPTSTSTNMTELCMLSCSNRDSLQSGCDLHNLCSPGHQCDPSCNSSQNPLHPLPGLAGMS